MKTSVILGARHRPSRPADLPAALPLFDSTDSQACAAVDWMLG
ncbi:hypothetical protein ROSA5918_07395 [Roseateles saccharophilus]|uniref:Uncharacterized protein n=1 Tax=Roseateles saccharophilus TaxID=304 RepID=A0A4R3UZC2_ROSSA|nr:hypothetical protein EV671_101426 [Roseateles saccharophilus]